jgi:hypothetical protein
MLEGPPVVRAGPPCFQLVRAVPRQALTGSAAVSAMTTERRLEM